MSRLDLVVGPNGAGKSSFVRFRLAPSRPGVPFVNADVIARERWPDEPEAKSYEAARIAEAIRTTLVDGGHPFIAETVFSHPSKVDLVNAAIAAGFDVHVHVVMVPVDLAIARVAARVDAGGHHVPEDKIRTRHNRLWGLVVQAAMLSHQTTFWDNSGPDPRKVGVFGDEAWLLPPDWPVWTPDDLKALGGR